MPGYTSILTGVLCTLICGACTQVDPQLQQCLALAEHYSAPTDYLQRQVSQQTGHKTVALRFKVKAAIGDPIGTLRCEYRPDEQGTMTAVAIHIGNKQFHTPADIADILGMNTTLSAEDHAH